MIKALNRETALKYAETLNLGKNDYVIFDLGKNLLLVAGSTETLLEMAEESAESFVHHFQTRLYDTNENGDEKKLLAKTALNASFVKKMSAQMICALESEHIFTAVVNKGGYKNDKRI